MAESLKLSLDDGLRFNTLEKVIDRNKKAFIEAGEALQEIRDKKLYREKWGTFEEYCLKRWGWSKSNAYRMIDAMEVAKTSPMGDKIANERQARALADVPPDKHEAVLKEAAKAGPVTGKSITKAAKSVVMVTMELDKEGFPIPPQARPTWERRGEPERLLSLLSDVRVALTAAQQSKDPLYCEVNFSAVFADIGNAYSGIKRALPYAVCLSCQGKLPEKCRDCGGRGMVSKLFFDQYADAKAKEMRTKLGSEKK